MRHFDVFNGDADGICALHQLRLANPIASSLITGVKREVGLLRRVAARPGDSVTVLDISIDANRVALRALLRQGVDVEYFDHHGSGAIPRRSNLTAHIDTASDICTSMLVDRHLGGQHRLWAIVGAFGDNLAHAAHMLAQNCDLRPEGMQQLRELGESINYNAYGDNEADLMISPARLYETLRPYPDPFDFAANESIVHALCEGRRHDMDLALQLRAEATLPCGTIYVLPNEAWTRRVRGIFANHLATSYPDRAHAVLTGNARGDYTVSVRAPLAWPYGADELCRQFGNGGGRAAAAGINRLARTRVPEFVRAFEALFRVRRPDQDRNSSGQTQCSAGEGPSPNTGGRPL